MVQSLFTLCAESPNCPPFFQTQGSTSDMAFLFVRCDWQSQKEPEDILIRLEPRTEWGPTELGREGRPLPWYSPGPTTSSDPLWCGRPSARSLLVQRCHPHRTPVRESCYFAPRRPRGQEPQAEALEPLCVCSRRTYRPMSSRVRLARSGAGQGNFPVGWWPGRNLPEKVC